MLNTGSRETVDPTRTMIKVRSWLGRDIDGEVYLFVDKVFKLKEEKGEMEVLDEIVRFFKKHYPQEYKETVEISKDLRKSRGDELGRGDRLLHREARKANFRAVMNLPNRLVNIIRKVYSFEELPFDRKFLKMFGRKYPEFLVPEKGVDSFSS